MYRIKDAVLHTEIPNIEGTVVGLPSEHENYYSVDWVVVGDDSSLGCKGMIFRGTMMPDKSIKPRSKMSADNPNNVFRKEV